MGVDTGRRDELIAASHSTDEIRRVIDADSLGFLSKAGLLTAVGGRREARCTACFDGVYPTDVPLEIDKLALERR
jgi:amidophosphoribosyltransferase